MLWDVHAYILTLLYMLSFLCGMLSNLGFPQKDTLRQEIKCKWFIWKMIPGSTSWGSKQRSETGKGREANKWCINKLVTDGVKWSRVSLMSMGVLGNTHSEFSQLKDEFAWFLRPKSLKVFLDLFLSHSHLLVLPPDSTLKLYLKSEHYSQSSLLIPWPQSLSALAYI